MSKRVAILVIHGPNLQLLGMRQPEVYGHAELSHINQQLRQQAARHGVHLDILQSNHEGELVGRIGGAKDRYQAILINPAAYTHTSVAIRDAIEAAGVPTIEVHLSNIYARESFRQQSLIAPVCRGQVSGFGPLSYQLALDAAIALARSSSRRASTRTGHVSLTRIRRRTRRASA